MGRRVNFTSFSDGAGDVKLPNIREDFNWVAERPAQRRYHSEPRHVQGDRGVRKRENPYLPPAGQNGALVDSMAASPGYTQFRKDGVSHIGGNSYSRRQLSLPARKPGADSRARKVNSAPGKDKAQSREHQRPEVAIVVCVESELPTELQQRTHGMSTRHHDESYLRSNKFATSWAQARAEIPKLRESSPRPGEEPTPRGAVSRADTSPEQSPQRETIFQSSTHTIRKAGQPTARGRTVHRRKRRKAAPAKSSPHPSNEQKQSTPDTSRKRDVHHSQERENGVKSQRTVTANGYHHFIFDEDLDHSEDGEDIEQRGQSAETELRNVSTERKATKKEPWDNRVNIYIEPKPPPKLNSTKYEKGLTFKPKLTSSKDVYEAYVGDNKPDFQRSNTKSDLEENESDEDYYYDDDEFTMSPVSSDQSPGRGKKERVLNRREAEMYIKMNAVYGSDAYKKQRKEWFLQKLANVQEQQQKLTEEKKQAERKKREEDRRRQQEQLKYVRNRFRREQVHRFRTQYVTSRVLEHEQANRHVFGLPEDFDDINFAMKQDDQDERDSNKTNSNDVETNKIEATPKHDSRNEKNVPGRTNVTKDKDNSKAKPGIKKEQQKQKNGKKTQLEQQRLQHQKEMERLYQAKENQKSWYANAEPNAQKQGPPRHNQEPTEQKSSAGQADEDDSDQTKNRRNDNVREKEPTRSEKRVQKYGSQQSSSKDLAGRSKEDKRTANDRRQRAEMPSQKHLPARQSSPNEISQGTGKTEYGSDRVSAASELGENGSKTPQTAADNNISNERSTDNSRRRDKANEDGLLKDIVGKSAEGATKTNLLPPESANVGHGNVQSNAKAAVDVKNESDKYHPSSSSINGQDNVRENAHSKNNTLSTGNNRSAKKGSSSDNKNVVSVSDTEKNKHSPEKQKLAATENNILNKEQPTKDQPPKTRASQLHKNTTTTPNSVVPKNKDRNDTLTQPTVQTDNDISKRGSTHRSQQSPPNDSNAKRAKDYVSSTPSHSTTSAKQHVRNLSPSNNPKRESVHDTAPVSKTPADYAPSQAKNRPAQETPHVSFSQAPGVSRELPAQGAGLLQHRPAPETTKAPSRNDKVSKEHNASKARGARQTTPKGNASLAAKMFDVRSGPSWDPKSKTPKMEGIDTVVLTNKDGKGRVTKRKKKVKDVVKEAGDVVKASTKETAGQRPNVRQSEARAISPDVTLGSDFDIEDDDEETEDDIFERLRRKYNIKIDSDEEDDPGLR